MKDHMKVSLSKVLESKDSREDSREEHLKAEPYCTSCAKLRIPSSQVDIDPRIYQYLNDIATGIDYASNKGNFYVIQDSSVPSIKD